MSVSEPSRRQDKHSPLLKIRKDYAVRRPPSEECLRVACSLTLHLSSSLPFLPIQSCCLLSFIAPRRDGLLALWPESCHKEILIRARKAHVIRVKSLHQQQYTIGSMWTQKLTHFSSAACLVIALALVLLHACASANMPQIVIHPHNGQPVRIVVEVANTPEKRSLGLMFRKDLPASHGMLFIFPHEEPLAFWMKNTPLPLDIVFINAARTVVNIVADTIPFSEKPLPSTAPAQFVLEVHAGFCQKHGITAGAQVDLPGGQPPAT